MKYLSVILFAVFMSWTWAVINTKPAISLETHIGIQNKLASIIESSVKNKKPDVSGFVIQNLWTEPVDSGDAKKVKAHFSYSFNEPVEGGGLATSSVSGDALLEKQDEDESGLEKWSLTNVKTSSDSVSFSEAMVITTGDSKDVGPAEDANPVTEPPEPETK